MSLTSGGARPTKWSGGGEWSLGPSLGGRQWPWGGGSTTDIEWVARGTTGQGGGRWLRPAGFIGWSLSRGVVVLWSACGGFIFRSVSGRFAARSLRFVSKSRTAGSRGLVGVA